MNLNHKQKTAKELEQEIDELRYQLQVAEDTIEAIRTGSVDALAVQENGVTKIFTLEGAEETYRVLVENMSEGAVTFNRQGLILYCNTQFARLVNFPLNKIIGTTFNRFLPSDYQELFQKIFSEGWEQHVKGEFILQPHEKKLLHVYISLTTILDNGDQVLGMVVTNLSEKRELDKLTNAKLELSRKNDELVKINEELDMFVYAASHDLKAPILNIEGLVNVLGEILQDRNSEEIEQILHLINNSVGRFKTTILDLTEISRVQKDLSAQPELIYGRDIIEEVMADLGQVIKSSKAEITLNIEEDVLLRFSSRNFKSIVYNLLSNAIKYRSPDRKPVVLVEMKKSGNQVLLRVSDNGLGIDLKNEARLFTMFERLHDHVEGSGVGLYLVKRIMDNVGGKIEVDSEVGKGTTFKLYFNRP